LCAWVFFCTLLLPINISNAQDSDSEMPEVMLLGVFHFSNPGLDTVKIEKQLNVMDEASQEYLQALAERIVAEFKPTKVLLEFRDTVDDSRQEKYKKYLRGDYDLEVAEDYQLGFRIAKLAGGIPIVGYDDRSVNWDAGPLFKIMPEVAPEAQAHADEIIEAMTKTDSEDHATLTLQELLIKTNDLEEERANKDLYLMTNWVASEGNYEGANASATWWERNFRMYAKIQREAKPGERLLVIGGQGHTAILKDFLAIDSAIKGVDVRPLF